MALTKSAVLQLALSFFISHATAQGWLASQLSEVNSYNYVRFTECTSFISTCQPTISACASVVCAQCTSLGAKPINSCCAENDPVDCFIAYRGGATPATTTAAESDIGSSAPSSGVVLTSGAASSTGTFNTDTGLLTGTMTATGSPMSTSGSGSSAASGNTVTVTASSSHGAAQMIEAHFAPAFGGFSMVVAMLALFL